MGTAPVVPIINRPRIRRRTAPPRLGRSELLSALPLSDAACKIATDMMISAESHAMRRRYALGFDKDDFVHANGKPFTPWESVAGVLWASSKSPSEDGVSDGAHHHSLDDRPAMAVGVVSASVLRALAAPPEGLKEEAIGGHARTLAHDGGGLYFTRDELQLLRPPTPVPRGAFSIWT